jgi:cobyrinic acid a,c-diamide synthase
MVLGAGLEDAEGERHAMAGLLSVETTFRERRLHLGYERARLLCDSALGPAGTVLCGHEFHYATAHETEDEPLFAIEGAGLTRSPAAGSRRGSVTGTFLHVIDRAG